MFYKSRPEKRRLHRGEAEAGHELIPGDVSRRIEVNPKEKSGPHRRHHHEGAADAIGIDRRKPERAPNRRERRCGGRLCFPFCGSWLKAFQVAHRGYEVARERFDALQFPACQFHGCLREVIALSQLRLIHF